METIFENNVTKIIYQKSLKVLNDPLADELTAINQYMVHSEKEKF